MKDFNEQGLMESDLLHQEDLLRGDKGWFKFAPQLGVGIDRYIGKPANAADLAYEARRNFAADGLKVKTIHVTDKGIDIDANY